MYKPSAICYHKIINNKIIKKVINTNTDPNANPKET